MLSNREGTSVDPVPFFVMTGLTFLLCFAVGPLYLQALVGIGVVAAVGWSFTIFLCLVGCLWYRFVWDRRPKLREEVPADQRMRKIYYGMVGFGLTAALLMLPLW